MYLCGAPTAPQRLRAADADDDAVTLVEGNKIKQLGIKL